MAETLKCGMKAADFAYCTADRENILLSGKVKEAEKTFLIFSRYMGCPFCQVDMMDLCESYPNFHEKNAQIIVVLQSSVETMRSQSLIQAPFDIACDPEMKLYRLYDVKAASSTMKMINLLDKKLFAKAGKLLKRKLKHGAYEGNEQQLPALFLLDKELNVLHAHYAKSISDLPDTDEMLHLL